MEPDAVRIVIRVKARAVWKIRIRMVAALARGAARFTVGTVSIFSPLRELDCFGSVRRNLSSAFRFYTTFRDNRFAYCVCLRPFNAAIAGSSRTRFRRGLRLSRATTALPPAVNARPSGLPPRPRKRHALVSEALPPPGARSSIRAIAADSSLSRYSRPSGPISRSLKSAQAFVSVLSGTQTAQATSVCFPPATGHSAPSGKALCAFQASRARAARTELDEHRRILLLGDEQVAARQQYRSFSA